MSTQRTRGDRNSLEVATGVVLMAGLVASLLLLVAGVVSLYTARGHLAISNEPDMYLVGKGLVGLLTELISGRFAGGPGVRLMTVGIVILILTPYVRVITSVAYFAWQRDLKYLAITVAVLVILTLSLILH